MTEEVGLTYFTAIVAIMIFGWVILDMLVIHSEPLEYKDKKDK